MTNINCSENCTYSINGKCSLNSINEPTTLTNLINSCAYFNQKTQKKDPQIT